MSGACSKKRGTYVTPPLRSGPRLVNRMKQDNIIRILFVEDNTDSAEQHITVLRNNGVAVRPVRASNMEELDAVCAKKDFDLAMVNPNVPGLSVADVKNRLDTSGRDFALVGVVDTLNDETLVQLFAEGVHGLALRSSVDQMVQVVRREQEALNTRRAVRRMEAALRESERRCDSLLESSRDPIAYVHEGVYVRANHAYLEIFGYTSFEDIQALTLLDMVASENAADFKDLLKRLSKGEKPPEEMQLKARRADGEVFDARMEFAQATFEDEACIQVVLHRELADDAQVREQMQRDPATDLYHRTYMLERIDQAVGAAAAEKTGQALLLVEPDNWESVVEAVGLANIDNLMRSMAERVSHLLDANAVAGRMGEHRIGILLEQHDDEQVRQVVQSLLDPGGDGVYEAGSHSLTLTFSVGGSLLGEKNASTQDLLEQADKALRSAQGRGTGMSQVHDPAERDKAEAETERQWLELVQDALANDRFVLYQQQIVSLHDASGEHMEILLRMNGPNGEVTPGHFLPVAERHGLMSAIDCWIVGQAIALLRQQTSAGQASCMFVKLSPDSINDEALINTLQRELGSRPLPQGSLVLEMPESRVLTSLKPVQAFVEQLSPLGVAFALEQFGSGLNSDQLLKHVKADYLKLDRSYMADLSQQEESQRKIKEMADMARELGKTTVAEWVEDAASTSILFDCGVDFVQGNFLSEPVRISRVGGEAA